jgi:hypothetical protein
MVDIHKKRIRSLQNNLPKSLVGKKLTLALEFDQNSAKAQKVGFSDNPTAGDTILPKAVGPATRFNSYGKDKILRDQQKETLYRTMEWSHVEWHGRDKQQVTTLVDVPYKRYPREHIDGYGHELTIKQKDGKLLVTLNDHITYNKSDEDELLSAINVFLDIFGYVEVYDEQMEAIPSPGELRRMNWIVLPKGEKITEAQLKDALSQSKRVRPVELLRQERISSFKPDIRAVGMGGFTGYVIYIFTAKHIAVLESIRYGNASYVIASDNWEELSKMTKQQLLSNSLVNQREIHTKAWFAAIKRLLGDDEAKESL